jgi:hypothetical protein
MSGRETVERLVRIFGQNNVYVELQRHCEREEEWRNQAAIRIARSLQLPVLATKREGLELIVALTFLLYLRFLLVGSALASPYTCIQSRNSQ